MTIRESTAQVCKDSLAETSGNICSVQDMIHQYDGGQLWSEDFLVEQRHRGGIA